jgi:hypothetical protein
MPARVKAIRGVGSRVLGFVFTLSSKRCSAYNKVAMDFGIRA